jgi:hypothetical protein
MSRRLADSIKPERINFRHTGFTHRVIREETWSVAPNWLIITKSRERRWRSKVEVLADWA